MRIAALCLLASLPALVAPPRSEGEKLNALLERYWEEVLVRSPITATAIGDPRYNDRFPNDLTAQARAGERAFLKTWLHRLKALHREKLQGQDRLSFDILVGDLQLSLEGHRFPSHLLPIDQMDSTPTLLAQLGSGESLQPFKSVKDYEDFLKRGAAMVAWMDQAILNMKEGVKRGVVQPKIVMQKVLPQLEQLITEDAEKSVFWGPIKTMPATFSPDDKARLTEAYRKAVQGIFVPAYKRLRDFVRDGYLPHCRDTVGYGTLPQGKAWYAYRVKVMTTTQLDPETIHAMGQKEVARILDEMDHVKKEVGFSGDLHAFFKHLDEDPTFYYSKPEDLVAGYMALQKKINAMVPKLFDVFPKADYIVKPVEAFRAESASGASYQAGTPDGTRPGVFYINTFNLKAQPKFGMETLSIHEASPGHHFQISIAQEITGLPKFRRFGGYSAFAEGWALYAESLGKELGLFTDPYQWYGRLSDEQLRAMRLVVDTGLHAKGWSREQAIQFMKEHSSMAESDVVSEVERYIVWPGQALGYKLGQFAIRELRTEAEHELGARFDIKAFHRQVLVDGALPLDVLKVKLREWIRAQKATAP